MSQTVAQFYNFQLSAGGDEVIYRGVTGGNDVVEVRQPVADLDVMLVLIASILERSPSSSLLDQPAHRVDDVGLEPSEDAVVLALGIPPGVTRTVSALQSASRIVVLGTVRPR